MVQLVKRLSSVHEALGAILSPAEVGHDGTTCHPSAWVVEGGGSEVQVHPQMHIKFDIDQGDMRP